MGALTSRQNAGVEEADVVSNHAYKYPPRSGNYFGSHFIMGGERFDTPQPEAYLFGENADLNFLGSRPTPFPYPPPQSNEPTKTLKSLVNIRKESLRFVRCPEPVGKLTDSNKIGDSVLKSVDGNGKGTYYNIEFTFDCDSRCAITVYYFCTEEVTPTGVVYYPRDPSMSSQTYHYKKGANQQFCQISHVIDPSKYPEEDLTYNADREIIPIAIYCVVDEGQEEIRQSHTTIGVMERHSDGTYVLKALKQKLFVDGLCYLLQEIYGIENKNLDTKPSSDEETEDGGSECVICMCDVRDTLILPCRHLCLCNSCADSLRYQANNCPICRAPFRALLQIRALQRRANSQALTAPSTTERTSQNGSMENIPAGYESVSLIEALNGPHAPPVVPRAHPTIASPDTDTASQAAEILNRCNLERSSSTSLGSAGSRRRDRPINNITPEFRMSVLLAREEQAKRAEEKINSPLLHKLLNGDVTKSTLSIHSLDFKPDTGSVFEVSGPEEEAAQEARTLRHEESERERELEPDSDAERLSPLLTHAASNGIIKTVSSCARSPPLVSDVDPEECAGTEVEEAERSALRLSAPHLAHIDDTDTDEPDPRDSEGTCDAESCREREEDSDYFTPEESHTTILTAPATAPSRHKRPEPTNNGECTPQRWALPHHVISLPGTPLSQSSVRSSGDSYSSSSSTRQLLAPRAPRSAC